MNPRDVRRWTVRLGLLGLASAFMLGCPERADEITESASEPSFDFAVAGIYVEPGGPFSIDNTILAAIDTTVADAFGREGITDRTQAGGATFFGCGGAFCPAWEPEMRNASEDPRLPALGDADAAGNIGITPDSVLGGFPFAVFTFSGLNPNTTYLITLERLGVNVNQGLDHSNVLLDDPALEAIIGSVAPDAPDQLVRLGGSAGTTVGSNPYEIGTMTSDVGGDVAFNFFAFDGGGTNDILSTATQDAFDLPQYNYIVIYEGTSSAGTPVLRGQVGVELDAATGEPVNNALGPFPDAAYSISEMLGSPGGAGRPDAISVALDNLEELANGEYTAWLMNPGTGEMVPAVGTYERIAIVADRDPISGEIIATSDSLAETVNGVSSFVGGDPSGERVVGFRHELSVSDGTLPGGANDTVGFYTDFVLSADDAPGDGSPSASQIFWFNYTDQGGTPADLFDDVFNFAGSTSFGNFGTGRVYNGSGFGTGGIRENELSVDMEALSRPPVGYQLVAWLIREDGSTFRLPDITGPPPDRVDLTNADVSTDPTVVTQNGILEANFRVFANEANIDFTNFTTFMITLEPKAGIGAMGVIPVYQGEVPVDLISDDG